LADAAAVSIVIPAVNEEDSIGDVVARLCAAAAWYEVLVVDDGSTDSTGRRAGEAGARVIRHPYNKGNGAAVKTGIRNATGTYVLIVDADGQHCPDDARRLIERLGEYDLVVGARSARTQATAARRRGNAILNWLASYLSGQPVPDLSSGFRGARLDCLREFLHLLPNGFSTPTTTTLSLIRDGFNVTFVPIEAQPRRGRSKIRLARDGATFFLILLKVITIFSPLRVFVPISALGLALGLIYGAVNFWISGRIPNGAVLLLMGAVLVFLAGLISEQIAALRFAGQGRD
jgi:glycosyltransferase involved in cell wall biosynthesis